jgi:hypothetical protein
MSVHIPTSSPKQLLSSIKVKIDKGEIRTWSYDKDGDFTHTPDQWKNKAWLRPRDVAGELVLGIVAPKGTTLSKEVYGVYHGRFIEMMLVHFDADIARATATAAYSAHDSP